MSLMLYSNPMSRGRIARWMLEEVGQPYDVTYLDYGTGMKAADFLGVNPMGKVPTLVHDGVVVTEAAAICAYLADAFPDAGLAPPHGDPARAPYYRWMFFAAGPVEAAVTAKSLNLLPPADKGAMVGYGSFDGTIAALEKAVGAADPWLCGSQFTAADVYVGSQVNWGLMFKSMPASPVLQAYSERLIARPAYQRASALDDEAMQAKG
ncbi:glutathione S-transferase [Sphingomonas jejuensis]|uniref:Glutathione S-transferase n=1 Tax=Sphingomonas jejuensis TaxID=904715 RepID=A0ABX0XHL8_9SPHN|nr:glutathione S-transferase family protein [Sphingomonas jejuensis]NJC32838.1 glutathione S-transferase [Sphingomonas jejuensis]